MNKISFRLYFMMILMFFELIVIFNLYMGDNASLDHKSRLFHALRDCINFP